MAFGHSPPAWRTSLGFAAAALLAERAVAFPAANVPAAARASSLPPAVAPSRCDAMLADAIRRAAPALVPERCWRVGPIALGMSEDAVRARLGAQAAINSAGPTWLYAFPPPGGAIVAHGRGRLRLAELQFAGGRLVAIDDDPGSVTPGGACSRHHALRITYGIRAGPLLDFAGVRIGDAAAVLTQHFGLPTLTNRSRDWTTYLPVPISIRIEDGRIYGFAIARDEATLTGARPRARLLPRRAPPTCRLTGLAFGFDDGG